MAELLFELGCEELPARFVVPALDDIERVFKEECARLNVTFGSLRRFGTPRRLAILVSDVVEKTADMTKEVQGPSVKAAFEADGKTPRTPGIKFAESVKLPIDQLKRVTTPKGEYLVASVEEKGRRSLELMPEILGLCIRKIAFPKSMRWGDVEQTFGRPLHWIIALLGNEVVPVVFSDVKSGRTTRGHRFLAPAAITVDKPSDYEAVLKKAHVIPDIAERRALLVERLAAAAKKANGQVLADDSLLDQVVNLVELPSPVLGAFEPRHLDLPVEVLVQEMRSHQRYFSVTDASGKLMPNFIAVSNTPVKDEALSLRGYERGLRSRLTDGRFFFDEDRRTPLADRLEKLKRRTWFGPLGSMFEKTERIRSLAVSIAGSVGQGAHQKTIERAATLSKADLETGMVGEFPELQGVMGREYAKAEGESADVALAIFEHYLPRGASDGLPTADPGALIGLADRLDSLCGLFGIGKKPSGAKDDFALRRAAISFIRIVIARGYRFSLKGAVDEAIRALEPKFKDVKKKGDDGPLNRQVIDFFGERLRALWRESHRADVVNSVLEVGFDDLVAAEKRLQALSAYVGKGDFAALAATFKRVGNIVDKQAKDITHAPVDGGRLTEPAEKALHAEVMKARDAVIIAVKADDFSGAMAKVVALKPFVDRFFDKVMVMADDPGIKHNRVRLLMEIRTLFAAIADFSKIESES